MHRNSPNQIGEGCFRLLEDQLKKMLKALPASFFRVPDTGSVSAYMEPNLSFGRSSDELLSL